MAYRLATILADRNVAPNTVTAFGLALAIATTFTTRWPPVAAALVALSALADTADGALAVLTGRDSRLGYVIDSVADRLAEACWLVAFVLLGAPVWLVVLGGGLAWLHEYTRARATAAGMAEVGAVTVAERPTRVLVAIGTLAVPPIVTIGAAAWAALAAIGLGQLLVAVHRALR
jgi:CDP-diacylglycerol--glycerol-3-phosphate 3-phosphatidyltransferase